MVFRWTEEQTQFLKENYKRMTYKELGAKIGKDEDQVYKKCKRLGLSKKWLNWEEQFLKDNHKTMTRKELADHLERKESSVKGKMYSLGLSVSREELAFLKIVSCQREHGFLECSK